MDLVNFVKIPRIYLNPYYYFPAIMVYICSGTYIILENLKKHVSLCWYQFYNDFHTKKSECHIRGVSRKKGGETIFQTKLNTHALNNKILNKN